MDTFMDFVYKLATGNFFIIFIAIILFVVLLTAIYAICLERKISKKIDKLLEFNEQQELKSLQEEDSKSMSISNIQDIDETSIKEETIQEYSTGEVPSYEDDTQLESSREKLISDYEQEQEEIAIISTQELEEKLDELKSNATDGELHLDIQKYEEEQEQKAIISYEELKERACENILNVTDTDAEGIKVSSIDVYNVNEEPKKRNPYGYEEDFLKALKDFRASL